MYKQRFEVVSGYGAWAPYPPEELNRIIDKVHAKTSLRDTDTEQEKVQEVLDEAASAEVQAKYRLFVRPVPQARPEMRIAL